ncbi:MAG: amidohydrolase family protein [Deltaproteobacteria bacterium]|nr:amidohydrolase family protein [Deltaproteobacteria bacterium]
MLSQRYFKTWSTSPAKVLKGATIYAAEAVFAEPDFGSIEVGKRADLVLVEDNPPDEMRVG